MSEEQEKEELEDQDDGFTVLVPVSTRRKPRNRFAESCFTKKWHETSRQKKQRRKSQKAARKVTRKRG